MAKSDGDTYINDLNNSRTEEDIILNMTKIVKGFGISEYRHILTSNPLYLSLLTDIVEDVKIELGDLKESVIEELDSIKLLIESNPEDLSVLLELETQCKILLDEIDLRFIDLMSI